MDQPKTEGLELETSPKEPQMPKAKREPPSTPSSTSESEPAESPTPSPKRKKVAKDEGWRTQNGWAMMFCHRELTTRAQEVTLEYTSILAGKKVSVRIPKDGAWVWLPDANKVLELQQLASCRGPDTLVDRPFFVGSPSARQKKDRPFGPPKV